MNDGKEKQQIIALKTLEHIWDTKPAECHVWLSGFNPDVTGVCVLWQAPINIPHISVRILSEHFCQAEVNLSHV